MRAAELGNMRHPGTGPPQLPTGTCMEERHAPYCTLLRDVDLLCPPNISLTGIGGQARGEGIHLEKV